MKKDDLEKNDILCRTWETIKRRWWYIVLLVACTVFVFSNWKKIMTLNFDNMTTFHIIFILWIILLICPIFSEMELFGIKLKKEVEKVKEEVKEDIADLKAFIVQTNLNNFSNNQSLTIDGLWSREDLEISKKLLEKLNNLESERKGSYKIDENEKIVNNSAKQTIEEDKENYLFKIRVEIERLLSNLVEKVGHKSNGQLIQMIQVLYRLEIIDGFTSDLLKQIVKIANRGVHGEIVSDEYIEFIKNSYPEVKKKLEDASANLCLTVCPRCKYVGYSKYENVCPKCGYVYDEG